LESNPYREREQPSLYDHSNEAITSPVTGCWGSST